MLPIHDLNPRIRFPILTFVLIGINAVVFLWQLSMPQTALQDMFRSIAVVPSQFSAAPFSQESLLDVVRSMFLHGGYGHILGNMLYLFLFGDNLEDRLGKILFLVVYFVSGFAAVVAQTLADPSSTIPMIGASGAIAGVLGGYFVLFPTVRVRALIFLGFFASLQEIPAFIVLGFWFLLQLFNGAASLGANFQGGGVAFFAHVGGFIAGVILTGIFMLVVRQPSVQERENLLYERARRSRF